MNSIKLHNVGKRFNKKWIFRHINASFEDKNCYALMGANGSGKSTLLQISTAYMLPSEGNVEYILNDHGLASEEAYRQLSISAPYMELIEEFTLHEVLAFHQKIKGFADGLDADNIIEKMDFYAQRNKALKNFSSGMKQRLKLALAIYASTPFLFLDEPCSNLDHKGIDWYQKQLHDYGQNRLLIVCSNHKEEEIFMCNKHLIIEDYAQDL